MPSGKQQVASHVDLAGGPHCATSDTSIRRTIDDHYRELFAYFADVRSRPVSRLILALTPHSFSIDTLRFAGGDQRPRRID